MQRHDEMKHAPRTERIRQLNDRLRTTGIGGRTVVTRAIAALPEPILTGVLAAVREFADFTPGMDPYREGDFGKVDFAGQSAFFKIDYYDVALEWGSPDPADDTVTCRVLTIMSAEDL